MALLFAFVLACESPPAMESNPDVIWFRSRSVVSVDNAAWISAQSRSTNEGRWAGPLWVMTPRAFMGRHVIGHVRLYLREYEAPPGRFRTVDASDDRAMACSGLRAMLSQLADWNRQRGLQWDVQLGQLRAQVPDGDGIAQLERATCAGASGDPAGIARRYADRPK
jgi:hypothetical protein